MSRRKKKNLMTIISLLILMGALIAFYIWNGTKDSDKQERKEPDTSGQEEDIILASVDITTVQSLYLYNKELDLHLELTEEGVWISSEQPDRPIDQDKVASILRAFTEVKAVRQIREDEEDLGEYGLEPPMAMAEIIQKDGKTLTFKLGDEAMGGRESYVWTNYKKGIYLLNSSISSVLGYRDFEMTAVDKPLSASADSIYRILIQRRDQDDLELFSRYKAGEGNAAADIWIISQPYEEMYEADSYEITTILPGFASLSYTACVDYQAENMEKYGLVDPQGILEIDYYTDENEQNKEEFRLLIGEKDDNGQYYVSPDGSGNVYTMDGDIIGQIMSMKAFDIMLRYVNLLSIDKVSQIDIEIDGAYHTMSIEREEISKDGQEEISSTYYLDGKEIEEEAFKDIYQLMIGISYDSEVTGEIQADVENPYLTITYHIDGEKQTASYLPYNDNFYLIRQNDKIRFFADKRRINELVQAINGN